MACYQLLYEDDRDIFLDTLAGEMEMCLEKEIDPSKLKVLTEKEYMEVFA